LYQRRMEQIDQLGVLYTNYIEQKEHKWGANTHKTIKFPHTRQRERCKQTRIFFKKKERKDCCVGAMKCVGRLSNVGAPRGQLLLGLKIEARGRTGAGVGVGLFAVRPFPTDAGTV